MDFFYPRAKCYGDIKSANLVFNANLKEFAHKVSYLSNLETSGKISPLDAIEQIEARWEQLKQSKHQLGVH